MNILRLLLAGCVIFAHSPELIDGNRLREPLTMLGLPFSLAEAAVRGFFILSGFLITASWVRQPELLTFMRKRVLRIYPAFILCMVVCLAIAPFVGGQIEWKRDIVRVIILHPPTIEVFPGTHYPVLNGASWTIMFEFACYLTVALVGVLGLWRERVVWLLGVVCILATTFEIPSEGLSWYLYHYVRLAPWFLGGALIYFTGWKPPQWLPDTKTDISYGLYLYGWPAQKLLLWVWPGLAPWQLSLLALPAAAFCGWVSWILVEERCLKLKQRKLAQVESRVAQEV